MKAISYPAAILLLAVTVLYSLLPAQEATTRPAAAGAAGLAEPNLRMDGDRFYFEYHGEARNVQLLSGLLKDADPHVRERAALDLGQTDNPLASGPLGGLLKDPDLAVRCAALAGLADLEPNHVAPFLAAALDAPEEEMVLLAVRLSGRLGLSQSQADVEKTLARKEPAILTLALRTLTDLGRPAPAASLQTLLEHPSSAIRLAAARNALLSPAGAAPPASLLKVARQDSPQVRAAAMAALGRADLAAASPLLEEAAKSADPALRRGALWGWRYAAKADRIRPFLDDASPMVVLAAIEAAGELKSADCIPRLYELLPALPDAQAHFAARAALAGIAQDAVPRQAAEALAAMKTEVLRVGGSPDVEKGGGPAGPIGPRPPADAGTVLRNARAYAWLLGQYRSKEGLDTQLELLRKLPVDCPALLEVAGALARIGDPQAVDPLTKALTTCANNAPGYLRVVRQGQGSHLPFAEPVCSALIAAAGELKAYPALPAIIRLVEANFEGEKLRQSAAAAARALPLLATDQNRASAEKGVTVLLRDRASHGPESTFEACKAAARMKMASATGLLEKVLSERDGRQLIHASAWAIGRITGTVPAMPEPVRRQGNWSIRIAE